MRDIAEIIRESISVKAALLNETEVLRAIGAVAEAMVEAYRGDHKVLVCGNGGSAADAQHIAAELSGRFYFDRPPLYAEALHVNASYLTAVANDYTYADVFSRMVRACGRKGDVLLGLTTSGSSPNVVNAMAAAHAIGMTTVGMTGETGGRLRGACTHLIRVPSRDTARIQEAHITIGHGICEIVEARLFAPRLA
jgi:D-sedoheptulose 7-phosphate isomerase